MKRVLCMGDSNTWGFSPVDGHRMDGRWTRNLSSEELPLEIIEEGLNSRNAICKDNHMPEKCGFDMFKMMLMSHKPLDAVVLMLGTNDLKACYSSTAKSIAYGLREYIRTWMNPTLYEGFKQPKLLVIAPIELHETLPDLEGPGGNFDQRSLEQSKLLADEIKTVCDAYPVEFLDASKVAKASTIDGLHMDEDNHALLAKAVQEKLSEMLAE